MRSQTRAVLLTALLLPCATVVATAVASPPPDGDPTEAIRGPAAQVEDFEELAPRGRWNPATGTGELVLDNESYYTVFQGERDVETWRDTTGADVTGSVLERQATQGGGEILDLTSSIPTDQRTGRYASDDLTALVREPRLSSVDLFNSIGTELESIAELRRDESLLVVADWNYVEAEDLRIEVIDRDGNVTIQREVLSSSPTADQADLLPDGFDESDLAREVQGVGTTGFRSAYWLLDVGELDDGAYTLRIEGVDDLTSGEAAATVRFSVGADGGQTVTETPAPTQGATPTETQSATPTAAPTTTAETTAATQTTTPSPAATTATATPQTTGADGPGFGVATALVALVALFLSTRRQRQD